MHQKHAIGSFENSMSDEDADEKIQNTKGALLKPILSVKECQGGERGGGVRSPLPATHLKLHLPKPLFSTVNHH